MCLCEGGVVFDTPLLCPGLSLILLVHKRCRGPAQAPALHSSKANDMGGHLHTSTPLIPRWTRKGSTPAQLPPKVGRCRIFATQIVRVFPSIASLRPAPPARRRLPVTALSLGPGLTPSAAGQVTRRGAHRLPGAAPRAPPPPPQRGHPPVGPGMAPSQTSNAPALRSLRDGPDPPPPVGLRGFHSTAQVLHCRPPPPPPPTPHTPPRPVEGGGGRAGVMPRRGAADLSATRGCTAPPMAHALHPPCAPRPYPSAAPPPKRPQQRHPGTAPPKLWGRGGCAAGLALGRGRSVCQSVLPGSCLCRVQACPRSAGGAMCTARVRGGGGQPIGHAPGTACRALPPPPPPPPRTGPALSRSTGTQTVHRCTNTNCAPLDRSLCNAPRRT